MTLKVAVQMDPIETINSHTDSTFAMLVEGQKRGHSLSYYLPSSIAWQDGEVTALVTPIKVRGEKIITDGAPVRAGLGQMNLVLLRQDPPFDMMYITLTYLLEKLPDTTVVANNPRGVRNMPEKLFWSGYDRYRAVMPQTLITRDKAAIEQFRRCYGEIIIKPLYGNGGEGIFYLHPDDKNFNALYEMFCRNLNEPFVIQRYINNVRAGDKRVILIDGEPMGAINRIPSDDEVRSNIHVGARVEAAELTSRDRQICKIVELDLKRSGISFAGIDIIDGLLTEVNITSPTGLQELKRLAGLDLSPPLWDSFERQCHLATRG